MFPRLLMWYKSRLIASGESDRFQDEDIRGIFDHPLGIARRGHQIDYQGVACVFGIDFAEHPPPKLSRDGPTVPNETPSNVGDSTVTTSIFVIRASAGVDTPSAPPNPRR